MFVPTYLSLSRHRIYYFRWPLPTSSSGHREHIKLSLGTRDPKQALRLARSMTNLGELLFINQPSLKSMDYAQLKPIVHSIFAEALSKFRERIDKTGPITGHSKDMLSNSLSIAHQSIVEEDYSLLAFDKAKNGTNALRLNVTFTHDALVVNNNSYKTFDEISGGYAYKKFYLIVGGKRRKIPLDAIKALAGV